MIKRSIAKQLMGVVFVCYCVVALLVTMLHVYFEFDYTKKTVNQELNNYEQIFSPVLAKAMWHLNREQVQDILNGLHQVPIIEGVLIEKDQRRFMAKGKIIDAELGMLDISADNTHVLHDQALALYSHSFDIQYDYSGNTVKLGTVHLFSSNEIVFNRVQLGFVFLLVNAVIKGVALWLIFYWFSKRILIRPLKFLTRSVNNLSFDNLHGFKGLPDSFQRNELSDLSLNFSQLVHELDGAKKEVLEFNKKLEHQVQRRTQELEQEKQVAQDALKVKSEFLATISHEIRTPMNGVVGMLTLLANAKLPEKNQRYVSLAQSSAQDLLVLINDLLDVSKIEAGKLTLEHQVFNLSDVLQRIELLQRPLFEQKSLSFDCHYEIEQGLYLTGDSVRLGQIINNLLSNALKFTQQGGVSLTVSGEPCDEHWHLTFKVCDSGLGISPADQEKLFSPFVQADASTTRLYGGSGLGLSIVQYLCQMMGGTVSLDSELGKGSCFTVVLPFLMGKAHLSTDGEQTGKQTTLAPHKILLVEDNAINQTVASDMLLELGQQVEIAHHGGEALSMLQEKAYDLIFMDCQMPVMDGYEATYRLRNKEVLTGTVSESLLHNSEIPIVAMTANAMAGDKAKCLSVGMSDYLSKPIDIQQLHFFLHKYLKGVENENI